MLRTLDPGEFVQGTIFTCGLSDSYPDVPALGMLITARCDTAQDKADVYNYIPIVPVEAWIGKDGLELVAKRALANGLGGMKSALSDADMAQSIVDYVEYDAILNELRAGTSKQEKNIANRLQPFTPPPFDPVHGGGFGFRLNDDQGACGRARIGFYAFMCLAETSRT